MVFLFHKQGAFPLTKCFSGKPRGGPPILSPKAPNAPGTPPNRIRTKINYKPDPLKIT